MDNYNNIKGGYKVPDAYFSDLKAKVISKVEQPQEAPNWKNSLRSFGGFVLGFAAMVLFAIGIFKLTPKNAIENDSELDKFILYSAISEDEIIELVYPQDVENEEFNKAIDEYVDLYGGVEEVADSVIY